MITMYDVDTIIVIIKTAENNDNNDF